MMNPYEPPKTAEEQGKPQVLPEGLVSFRVSFFKMYPLVFFLTVGLITLLNGLMGIASRPLEIVIQLAATIVIQFISLAIAAAYFQVYVSPDGLRCFDFWGKYRFVRWDEITRQAPINVLGLKYLRVFGSSLRRPLWVPLFLQQDEMFWETTARLSGSRVTNIER